MMRVKAVKARRAQIDTKGSNRHNGIESTRSHLLVLSDYPSGNSPGQTEEERPTKTGRTRTRRTNRTKNDDKDKDFNNCSVIFSKPKGRTKLGRLR